MESPGIYRNGQTEVCKAPFKLFFFYIGTMSKCNGTGSRKLIKKNISDN